MLAAVTAMGTALCAAELNDYPTAARADYIFACMKTNGETPVLSLSQVPGRFGAMFRTPEQARTATNELKRAQAEAEVRCF